MVSPLVHFRESSQVVRSRTSLHSSHEPQRTGQSTFAFGCVQFPFRSAHALGSFLPLQRSAGLIVVAVVIVDDDVAVGVNAVDVVEVVVGPANRYVIVMPAGQVPHRAGQSILTIPPQEVCSCAIRLCRASMARCTIFNPTARFRFRAPKPLHRRAFDWARVRPTFCKIGCPKALRWTIDGCTVV